MAALAPAPALVPLPELRDRILQRIDGVVPLAELPPLSPASPPKTVAKKPPEPIDRVHLQAQRREEAKARAKRKREDERAAREAGQPPSRDRRHHYTLHRWRCSCKDWTCRQSKHEEEQMRVCKHIAGVQDDLDDVPKAKRRYQYVPEYANVSGKDGNPLVPGEDGLPRAMTARELRERHLTWEVEPSVAKGAAAMVPYLVVRARHDVAWDGSGADH